jgi:hypothetical protein
VLSGGTVIDGYGNPPIANGVVVIDGDRILAVGGQDGVAITFPAISALTFTALNFKTRFFLIMTQTPQKHLFKTSGAQVSATASRLSFY